jgi:Tannase and feruloyl esterase
MSVLKKTIRNPALAVLAGLAALSIYSSNAAAQSPQAPDCAKLVGLQLPAAQIGLPSSGARISTATLEADKDGSGAAREYCKVLGQIDSVDKAAQPIQFQINLPKTWNSKALHYGGGGFNGTVVTGLLPYATAPVNVPTPLANGYVTFGSDSGHASRILFDGSFGSNEEQFVNFAQAQVKKVVDTAKWLIQAHYGIKPRYTYFVGASQGGHEAFDAAQRYPADYEGVVAAYPAYNPMLMHMGSQAMVRAIYGNAFNKPSTTWVNPAKIKLLTTAVMQACDGLDGLTDGIVSNVSACQKTFPIQTVRTQLRCVGGADTGDTCLSDVQIETIAKIASPAQFGFAFEGGDTQYPQWPLLEGSPFTQNHLGQANMAVEPFTAPANAFQLKPATGNIRGFVTRDSKFDTLAFEPKDWQSRIQELSKVIDASSTDLSKFSARGAKMILMHGLADDSITPHNTLNYFRRLSAANGAEALAKFVRFYTIPGLGHGNGLFNAKWEPLTALEQWVEKGLAPNHLVATDGNDNAATAATNGRTRPVCQYGAYPKYTGPANPTQMQANEAGHFTCTLYQ